MTQALTLLAGVLAAIYLLHRLAIFLESRGWMYYRHAPPVSTAIGNAMQELHNLTTTQANAAQHERRNKLPQRNDSGEPPSKSLPARGYDHRPNHP